MSPTAEPTVPQRAGWISLYTLAWLGVWLAQLTPIQLLLPLQVDAELHPENWVESVVAFGIISGVAGACALIAYPLTGALSDHTGGRWGRRRPWILGGALLFAVALVLLGLQTNLWWIGVCWSLTLVGFCVLTAALTATISDQVPVGQRGLVSGFISAPQALGAIFGLVLCTELITGRFAGYVALAGLLVVLVLPFALRMQDEVHEPQPGARLTVPSVVQSLWISPRQFPDFGWTLLSRVLVNLGNALGTTLLLYFLSFGLGMGAKKAEEGLISLSLIYMFFVVVASLALGKWSDKIGRRKPFVAVAAALQAIAALLLAFVPQFDVALIAAGFLGLGYGCFLSVDQALATQVLPDAESRGKDLGIMNVATAVPQAFAPLLGAWLVAYVAGFPGLFLLAAFTSAAGALAVLPIRSVR